MYALRLTATRFAGTCEKAYGIAETAVLALAPLARRIGYDRLDRPVAAVESVAKGLLFDCRMCGRCALSDTGMSCTMNCPKTLRNGPCGGVRQNGHCEVKPSMRCVWVEAWSGSARMKNGAGIRKLQPPVDHRLAGRSAWVGLLRDKDAAAAAQDRG